MSDSIYEDGRQTAEHLSGPHKVQVRIQGIYANGHGYERIVSVVGPTEYPNLDDWFGDMVFPETGDGLPDTSGVHWATVFAPGEPYDGVRFVWEG